MSFNVGDPVEVNDPGLEMLRSLMPDAPPNHYGTVAEIWDDGTILVAFPIEGAALEEHSQVAPYPPAMVKKRSA